MARQLQESTRILIGTTAIFCLAFVGEIAAQQPANSDDKPLDLPAHAVQRWGSFGEDAEGAGIYLAAYSPRGDLLATRDADQVIRLWETATGRVRLVLKGHEHIVSDIAFSPDGGRLVSTTATAAEKAILWDTTTGEQICRLAAGGKFVRFRPDGKSLLIVDVSGAAQFSAENGALIRKVQSVPRPPLALSPDTKWVAATFKHNGDAIAIFDATSLREMHKFADSGGEFVSGDFSPQNNLLATVLRREPFALVWDVENRKVLHRLEGHSESVQAVAFSPSGRFLATTSWDNTVRIWETSTGALLTVLKGHSENVGAVAFSPDERRLASGASGPTDHSVIVWNVQQAVVEPAEGKVDSARLAAAWKTLGSATSGVAYKAVGILVSSPERAVALFGEQTRAVIEAAAPEEVDRLIEQLDADEYVRREAATRRLSQLRPGCDRQLKATLMKTSSVEIRLRLLRVLQSSPANAQLSAAELRRYDRLIYALEIIDTDAARKLLETLANSHPAADVVAQAQSALARRLP